MGRSHWQHCSGDTKRGVKGVVRKEKQGVSYLRAKEPTPAKGGDPGDALKFMKRSYIKAKIFIERNMENIDEAMVEEDIPDGQYLSTMDTLMIMKNAVLPMRLHNIKVMEMYVRSHKKTGGNMPERLALFNSWFRKYQDACNKIVMNRCRHTGSAGNNLMSIDQIAVMYDLSMESWNSDKPEERGQVVILMWSDKQAIEMFKSQVIPKWNREFKDRMEEELNELARLGY